MATPRKLSNALELDRRASATLSKTQDVFSFARHNRTGQVKAELEAGVDPDIRDDKGSSILIHAAQNNLKNMAKVALRTGIDINGVNFKGNTALHYCYAYGYVAGLGAYLVSKGADPDQQNGAGISANDAVRDPESFFAHEAAAQDDPRYTGRGAGATTREAEQWDNTLQTEEGQEGGPVARPTRREGHVYSRSTVRV